MNGEEKMFKWFHYLRLEGKERNESIVLSVDEKTGPEPKDFAAAMLAEARLTAEDMAKPLCVCQHNVTEVCQLQTFSESSSKSFPPFSAKDC